MPKLDWIRVVDRVLVATDHALDRVRKKPRRRLGAVPTPPVGPDPFVTAPKKADEIAPAAPPPLGDPKLAAQIYGKRGCMWSGRAVKIFQELGLPAKFYDLDDGERKDLEGRLIRETKQYQTPYVYLRGEYVGGFNALDELLRLGQIEVRTLPPEERANHTNRSRIKVEIAPREPETTPEGERS